MKCPKCGEQMMREGLEGLSGAEIMEQWVCPACGCRSERKRKRQEPAF